MGRTTCGAATQVVKSDRVVRLGSKSRATAKVESWVYTTRLQKGGALLAEMRLLVSSWGDAPAGVQRDRGLRNNVLNKRTRARLADVYGRAFLPRFVRGPIPDAWKLVRPLEDAQAPLPTLRPVYYWITARAEPLLADFCRQFILPRPAIVRAGIGT
jgi:hypothetical protein